MQIILPSLTNGDNRPVKMNVDPDEHGDAIECHSLGSTFGCDICIADNTNTTMESFSNLGFVYSHPQYG